MKWVLVALLVVVVVVAGAVEARKNKQVCMCACLRFGDVCLVVMVCLFVSFLLLCSLR